MLNLKRSHSLSFFCQRVGRNLKSFQAGSHCHSDIHLSYHLTFSNCNFKDLTAWMAHHKKEKRLQLIPCACHPDYQQGDHEVEDDPVAADGSAGTGLCAAACNSTKSNAFVHSDHIWYTEAKKVARPQHCKRKSHPARTSSKVLHRDAFSVHCVGSCCSRLSFMYCKMMLMRQANRLSSPWCMVRYV